MVDLAEIQAVYYMVAATGVLVAAAYYIYNIRVTQRNMKANLETRQAQLFMQIYNRWDAEYTEAFMYLTDAKFDNIQEYMRLYKEDKTFFKSLFTLGAYFEGLGTLVRMELLDIRYVANFIAGFTRMFWEKLAPIIGDLRIEMNLPRNLSETEYLYNRLMKYMEEHPELKT